MSTAKKIFTNTIAQFAGKISIGLLSIISIKLLTGYLSQRQYGEYNFIYDFLGLFGIIADLGLYTVAVREMSHDENRTEILLGNILTIRAIIGALSVAAAVIIGFSLPTLIPGQADSALSYGIAIASITVLLALLSGTLTTVLQVKYKMKRAAQATILGKIISVGYIVYAVTIAYPNDPQAGFFHAVGAGVIGNIGMLAITSWYVKKYTRITFRWDWDIIRDVFIKALPYGIALVLLTIYFKLNTILIKFFVGPEEVALYAIGMHVIDSIAIISLYFMNSMLPTLTKSIQASDDKHKSLIQNAFDFLSALGIPLIAGGYVLAYPIVAVISDPKYLSRISEGFYGSDVGLQLLLVAMACSFINTLFSFILIAKNQQKQLLWINIGAIIVNLLINTYAIPKYGFRGAAVTSIFAEIFILIATLRTAHKYVQFNINMRNFFKIIASAIIMALLVNLIKTPLIAIAHNKALLIIIPFGGACYFAALWWMKVITKEKLQIILKKETPETIHGPDMTS